MKKGKNTEERFFYGWIAQQQATEKNSTLKQKFIVYETNLSYNQIIGKLHKVPISFHKRPLKARFNLIRLN